MADTSPERTYTHKVPTKVFKKLFSSVISKADIDELKLLGAQLLKGDSLKNKLAEVNIKGTVLEKITDNNYYYLVEDVEIIYSSQEEDQLLITGIMDFDKDLFFLNCNIKNLAIHNSEVIKKHSTSSSIHNIYFVKTIISSLSLVNTKIGDVIFDETSIKSFSISRSSTLGNIEILNNSRITTLKINGENKIELGNILVTTDCEIDSFEIEKCRLNLFEIKDSYVNELNLDTVKLEKLEVENVKSSKGFCFYDVDFSNFFEAEYFYSSIRVSKSIIPYGKVINSNVPELKIEGGSKMDLYLERVSIVTLAFLKTNLAKETSISFTTCSIYYCLIQEFASLGNLYFRDIKPVLDKTKWVSSLKKESTKEEKMKYEKFIKQSIHSPTFRLSQSSLGKTEFTDCDLAGFDFEFNNSKITEVFISGGTIPKVVNKNLNVLEQNKSFFEQLKKVFEGQGDIVRSTEYHARTSEIQMRLLLLKIVKGFQKPNKSLLKTIWAFIKFLCNKIDAVAEWVVYLLNWLSNKHGESWLRGFCFIVVIAGLFFWGYNMALSDNQLRYTFVGCDNIFQWESWRFLADYVKFIDVTHKFNFMVENPNPRAIVVDFVARIFIVYGIYQMVAAFRKHGKKG